MNFLTRPTVLRQLIGRHIRSCSDPQVVFFNKSSNFLKATTSAKGTDDVEDNKPINYFGSPAASWSAKQSHQNPNLGDEVWYQPLVMSVSLAIFLIYFCILREENDVDETLSMSLADQLKRVEAIQLEKSLQYNRANGSTTVD